MSKTPDAFAADDNDNTIPSESGQTDEPAVMNTHANEQAADGTEDGEKTESTGTAEREVYPSNPQSMSDLPPEAQGEANGGPLGCCLGVMAGLVISLSVALLSRFYAEPLSQIFGNNLANVTRVVMCIAAIIAVFVFGRIGWIFGKFAYREYEPPVIKESKGRAKSRARGKR